MNIVPTLYPVTPENPIIAPLLCQIQEQIVRLFCREDYLQSIGQKWSGIYDQSVALLNAQYALQNNPDDDHVTTIDCWYRNRYN